MSEAELLQRIRALEARIGRTEVQERPGVWTTYTPTYYGESTAGVTTYTVQVGCYMRVGQLIVAEGHLVWTAATGTGNARISLPVAASAVTNRRWAVAIRTSELTFTATSGLQGLIIPGANYFLVGGHTTNAVNASLAVEAAGSVAFTAVYGVD